MEFFSLVRSSLSAAWKFWYLMTCAVLCLGGGPVFLTLRDLDKDLCLLCLFFGDAGGVLVIVVGLFEGVLLLGGDLGVLKLLLGGVPSGLPCALNRVTAGAGVKTGRT